MRESYDLVVIVNHCELEGIRVSVRPAPPRQDPRDDSMGLPSQH